MLGGWKVEGVSELSDLILQSGEAPGTLPNYKNHMNVTSIDGSSEAPGLLRRCEGRPWKSPERENQPATRRLRKLNPELFCIPTFDLKK